MENNFEVNNSFKIFSKGDTVYFIPEKCWGFIAGSDYANDMFYPEHHTYDFIFFYDFDEDRRLIWYFSKNKTNYKRKFGYIFQRGAWNSQLLTRRVVLIEKTINLFNNI